MPTEGTVNSLSAPSRGFSSPPLPDWLRRWQARIGHHDIGDPIQFITGLKCEAIAQRLLNDIDLIRDFQFLYEGLRSTGVQHPEAPLEAILLQASVGYSLALSGNEKRKTPSERKKDLKALASSAKSLARRIQRDASSFRHATDHVQYLKELKNDPTRLVPSGVHGFVKDDKIQELLLSFATSLGAQGKQLASGRKRSVRSTAENRFFDSLIACCQEGLGQASPAFIAKLASVAMDKNVDESTIRKRPAMRDSLTP